MPKSTQSPPEPLGRDLAIACAILDAVDALACLLDGEGRIIAVNRLWREAAREHGLLDPACTVGASYLGVCERAAEESSEGAADVNAGVRAVLDGKTDGFKLVYPCFVGSPERWFLLQVRPLEDSVARALVTHRDATEQVLWRRRVQHRFGTLSPREREVLTLLVRGQPSHEIAATLGLSKNTIDVHRRSIMSKTRASNVAELVSLAITGAVVETDAPTLPEML